MGGQGKENSGQDEGRREKQQRLHKNCVSAAQARESEKRLRLEIAVMGQAVDRAEGEFRVTDRQREAAEARVGTLEAELRSLRTEQAANGEKPKRKRPSELELLGGKSNGIDKHGAMWRRKAEKAEAEKAALEKRIGEVEAALRKRTALLAAQQAQQVSRGRSHATATHVADLQAANEMLSTEVSTLKAQAEQQAAQQAQLTKGYEKDLKQRVTALGAVERAAEQRVEREVKRVRVEAKEQLETERAAHKQQLTQVKQAAAQRHTELLERVETLDAKTRGSPGSPGLDAKVRRLEATLKELCSSLDLDTRELPKPESESTHMGWQRNVRMVAAALKGRSADVIAAALVRNDQLGALYACKASQPLVKLAIQSALKVIQEHWSARCAVFLMAEVHTSRSEFDTLRHLLSFIYNPGSDIYDRIRVWENPHDEKDWLPSPALASRVPREAERTAIFGKDSEASEDGLYCGRTDVEQAAVSMVEHHWEALNPAVKAGEKPLMMVGSGDACGGWRGASVTHFELSIGSWAKGKGQSRLTTMPLYLMEGADSAAALRGRAGPSAQSFNKLIAKGKLTVFKGTDREQVLDLSLLITADFQLFKAMMNMSKYTSAIWCLCELDNLFITPEDKGMGPARTWADVLRFYAAIGCELKTLETMCELNHWSHEVLIGKPFKPVKCRWCPYKASTRSKWCADVKAHTDLDETAQREADLVHSRAHLRHYKCNPPTYHLPAIRLSADILHLVFINIITTWFVETLFVYIIEYDQEAREPCEAYFHSIGVPIKLAKAKTLDEVKGSLTGRDAKVILAKAETHIPALLQFANAGKQAAAAAAEAPPAAGDDEFDWEGDGEDAADAGSSGDDGLDRELRDAKSWDVLLRAVHEVRVFEEDTDEYHEQRAVAMFNAAGPVVKEYKRLVPNAQSATAHVLQSIVPRQMKEWGDPMRRGADHGEALGASIKDGVHNRTLRRRKAIEKTTHVKRDAEGNEIKRWQQAPLAVSRIMQVWRDMVVREKCLRDESSAPYLQRTHFRQASTGYATVHHAAAASAAAGESSTSIMDKVKELREHA